MIRAKLLNVQFSFVETQPEILIDSRPGWRCGERGEKEVIVSPDTPGSLHITTHSMGAAVHLVSTAGGPRVGTAADTLARGQGTTGGGVWAGIFLILLASLEHKYWVSPVLGSVRDLTLPLELLTTSIRRQAASRANGVISLLTNLEISTVDCGLHRVSRNISSVPVSLFVLQFG